MTRRVFNIITDESGQPLVGVPVRIQLNVPTFVAGEQKEIAAWSIETKTDANGRWEVELEPNDLMSDPNSYYKVIEYSHKRRKTNEYAIRVPSTGYTEPIHITNLLITPPPVTPTNEAVTGIAADNNALLKGDVRLLAGTGIQLQQDNNAKTITIVNTGGGGGGGGGAHNLLSDTHLDTQPTAVQRGMLIVGQLVSGVLKWAGLALGAAGKFLKSNGTDVVWGDVDWTEVQNKPSTFPPSPHTHNAADIVSGRLSASRLPTSPNANRFLVVRTSNSDPTYDVIQASDLPSHTHSPTQITPQGSGSGLDADTVDGQHASDFAPATHTHTKSQITDLETITTTPTANAVPKADATGKIALGWIPQGSGSNLDADKLDGLDSTAFERVANKGVANGYAPLDASAKLPTTHLPSHASTHAAGGSDPITGNLDANARVAVQNSGTLVGTRRAINFIAGTNVSLNIADDATNERVNVTINATGGSGVGLDVYPKILTPGSGWDDTTSAALWEMVTYTNTKQEVLRYPDNTAAQRWWEIVVLDAANFAGSFKIVWSSPVAAPSGGDAVVWEVAAGVINAGGSVDPTLTTVTVTGTRATNEAANIQKETTATLALAGVQNGSRIIIRIRRLGADANDTLAGDVRLHKVVID
jgi:hypothetical protein